MAEDPQNRVRDLLVFLALAFVPTIAVGVLGLRALDGEEAAQRRETESALEASADRARLRVDRAFIEADAALAAIRFEEDPRKTERDLARITPPFAAPVILGKTSELIVPAAPREEGASRDATSASCEAQTLAFAAIHETTARKAARAKLLASCPEARSASGRFVYPIVALDGLAPEEADALIGWLEVHAALLSAAEREATREEVRETKALPEAEKKRAFAALDASPSQRAEVLATLRSEPASAALRQGPDRAGMMRFREGGVVGVLRALEDGRKVGFVMNAESLGTAVAHGWLELASDQRASLGRTNERGAGAVAAVSPGLFLRVAPKDPLAIEKRASKSRLVLTLLGVGAVACSLVLLAVLWARIRAARRTSELRVDFIAAISHELRTPASSLRMFGELLAGGHVAPEEQREIFEAVEREANRLGDTIERMLSLGRIAKGKLEPVRAETDVSALLGEVIDAFEARTRGAPSVERDLDQSVKASVDAGLLRLAVDNLLENARKYAPEGSPYRVTLRREAGRVAIRVEDHGPGIAKRDQKRIFQPFERLDDKLSRSTEGSGLGLSLVRHVARAHGGDARVESELGKGATFVLTIAGGKAR